MATHLFDRLGHGNSKLPAPVSKKVAKKSIKNQGPALTGTPRLNNFYEHSAAGCDTV